MEETTTEWTNMEEGPNAGLRWDKCLLKKKMFHVSVELTGILEDGAAHGGF